MRQRGAVVLSGAPDGRAGIDRNRRKVEGSAAARGFRVPKFEPWLRVIGITAALGPMEGARDRHLGGVEIEIGPLQSKHFALAIPVVIAST
jgi:hypothetical protein